MDFRVKSILSSVLNVSRRSLHYKQQAKNYPKVNVNEVELEKPRYGFRKERKPLISQGVKDTLFPASEIKQRYQQEGKPIPIKFKSNSDKIARRNYEKYQDEVVLGKPHFRVGEKKIYFPQGRICLLRPNAKHSPYQAKFLVPKSMNKMDLRDYLWHVYGLRALNVTVQLLHAKFVRGPYDYARYRGPQYKKMTIDMAEPFVWPEVSPELVEMAGYQREEESETMIQKNRTGSDKLKPIDTFDGIYKTPQLPNLFVSDKVKKQAEQQVKIHTDKVESRAERELVSQFLGL
ncbi:ribosomal protein L23-domain-containing protein [Scheffersomyces xylosifermentans]|uniref:ribosomal protein L23-domain-containing protein n=1 Tax=Scheffersomyces xylosifermentans TaxID=1304137 RepID=UPI00315D069A